MRNLPFRFILASASLLVGPAALADSTTTIPAFDARIDAARQASSPGGTTVTRAEMKAAVDLFLNDDQRVDTAERAHLGAKLTSSTFLAGVTGAARKYLGDTHELNDTATTAAPLGNFPVSQPPAELYGAAGDLASYSEIREGYIPNGQGVANQQTLVETFNNNSGLYVKQVAYFTPISTQELIERLGRQYITTQPTVDEVEGALAYIHQIYRNSNRLYIASYTYSYYSGWTEGFVVAAVSSDRRFVRFVDVLTYGE